MADNVTEIRGLDALIAKMKYFPQKFKQLQGLGMKASLNILWENVPPYPPQPADSTYQRTGTLGRTLGSSESGGKSGGRPSIFTVKGLGTSNVEGRFGTNLDYAEHVIGDQQARQNAHWWKLSSVLQKSEAKIKGVWEGIMKQMAKFLDSRSSGAK